jgi:hypothetical protein
MKKLLLLLLTTTIYADDLDLGDDFSTGETVTAEKFNSKFNKLETVSRLVKDSDLIGTWKCRSILNYESSPFKQFDGGFLWYLDGVITFSESNQNPSVSSPKNWSGDLEMLYDSNTTSGKYSLFAGYIFFTLGNDMHSRETMQIYLTSENQLRMNLIEPGGGTPLVTASLCEKSS